MYILLALDYLDLFHWETEHVPYLMCHGGVTLMDEPGVEVQPYLINSTGRSTAADGQGLTGGAGFIFATPGRRLAELLQPAHPTCRTYPPASPEGYASSVQETGWFMMMN